MRDRRVLRDWVGFESVVGWEERDGERERCRRRNSRAGLF